jgi:hypothetical protein
VDSIGRLRKIRVDSGCMEDPTLDALANLAVISAPSEINSSEKQNIRNTCLDYFRNDDMGEVNF